MTANRLAAMRQNKSGTRNEILLFDLQLRKIQEPQRAPAHNLKPVTDKNPGLLVSTFRPPAEMNLRAAEDTERVQRKSSTLPVRAVELEGRQVSAEGGKRDAGSASNFSQRG